MKTLCDRLLPQDDRDDDHKIPIVNFIDERLYEGRIDGYRYEDMPPDPAAYRLGLQAIEQIAQHMSGASFIDLTPYEQDQVLLTLHDHNPPAAHEIWQKMSVKHLWAMLMRDAVTAYYAHPYARDEIGFGGPAYPRGYMRLEHGRPEPWESDEKRYEWEAPVAGGPVAINAGSYKDHPHCIYRCFCIQGCKVGAKQDTLVSHVPDALRYGAEIRANCMVARINMKNGKTTGVTYFDKHGKEHELKAKVVIVSGYAIETPRLLLNSACPGFEQGLANSSGTLGKYLMVQIGNIVLPASKNRFACTKPRLLMPSLKNFTRQTAKMTSFAASPSRP